MGFLDPVPSDQQEHLSALDVEHAVQDASSVISRDRDADLLPATALACIERWSLGDNGLIEHQDNGALPCRQATFEPPFACRHVVGRRARLCRGRFHRKPKRAMVKLTLGRETSRW